MQQLPKTFIPDRPIRTMQDRPDNWNDIEEIKFKDWYGKASKQFNLDPNPDNPLHEYNYRFAYKNNAWPDSSMHWPSDYKTANHPNRFVDGQDTITGNKVVTPKTFIADVPEEPKIQEPKVPLANEEPGFLKSIYDWMSTAPEFITKPVKQLGDAITDPSVLAKFGSLPNPVAPFSGTNLGEQLGFYAGAGEAASQMATPLNALFAALGGTEVAAARAAMPNLFNAARTGNRIASLGVAEQGLEHTLDPESTLGQRLLGIGEMAGGALGARNMGWAEATNRFGPKASTRSGAIIPEVLGPERAPVQLPPKQLTTTPVRGLLPQIGDTYAAPRFFSGTAGIADNNMRYGIDSRLPPPIEPTGIRPDESLIGSPSVLPEELGEVIDIGAILAANTGKNVLKDPAQYNPAFNALVPDRYRSDSEFRRTMSPMVLPKENTLPEPRYAPGGEVVNPIEKIATQFDADSLVETIGNVLKVTPENKPQFGRRKVSSPEEAKVLKEQGYVVENGYAVPKVEANLEKLTRGYEGLVKSKAPDLQYKAISPNKSTLKKGETWKSRVEGIIRQQRGSLNLEDNTPSFAKAKQGGLVVDADIKRTATNITKDYTGSLSGIMVREGLQNAMDAVNALGPDGIIKARVNPYEGKSGAIEIYDNGSGLDETALSEKLVRLFASGKENEAGATGGKGIGSASYILGGEKFEIETVAVDSQDGKKYLIRAGGTPDQFLDPVHGSDWEKTEVPIDTPTGTTIKTYLKDNQYMYRADEMLGKVMRFSRNRNSKLLNVSNEKSLRGFGKKIYEFDGAEDEYSSFSDGSEDIQIGRMTTSNKPSDVNVSIEPYDRKQERSYININYLNNGMYQFSETLHLEKKIKDAPEHVIVDVRPKADEMHDDYPFINTREDMKKDIKEEIQKYINEVIKEPAQKRALNRTQELYDQMAQVEVPGLNRKAVIFDPGERLFDYERDALTNSHVTQELVSFLDETIESILKSANNISWAERLEGVGLVLDPGMHGVHIPNPTTGKSTILLNPFIRIEMGMPVPEVAFETVLTALHEVAHIGKESGNPIALSPEDLSDPRVGKYLATYINELINHGDVGFKQTGHGMGFAHRLGEVYAKYGTKQTFRAADQLTNILSDESGRYSPEVQKLLQIYTESRGREATTEDLLSGTGVKSENRRPGGKKDVSGNRGSNEKRTPGGLIGKRKGNPVENLKRALSESIGLRAEQSEMYSQERGDRARSAQKIKTKGFAGFKKQLSKLKGELDKVDAPLTKLTTQDLDGLIDVVSASNLKFYEKIRAKTALAKVVFQSSVLQENEIKLLGRVFGADVEAGFVDLAALGKGLPTVAYEGTREALTFSRSIMTAFDLSFPLRQGLGLVHKREFRTALAEMFKAIPSDVAYEAVMKNIQDNKWYDLATEVGVPFNDFGANRSDYYQSRLAEKIPGVKMSARAFNAMANKLRMDVFASLMDSGKIVLDAEGAASAEQLHYAKQAAKFIGDASGQGSFGKKMDQAMPVASWFFFSPRLIASRVNLLTKFFNPVTYINTPWQIKKEYLKSLFAIAAMGSVMTGLMQFFGAEELETDARSADFMKSKFGDTRVDPWGGIQQYIVLAQRLQSGESISTTTGHRFTLGKKYGSPTGLDIAGRFAENKLSPVASFVTTMLRGKDYAGQPISVKSEVAKRLFPIISQDFLELAKSDPNLLPLTALAGLGMGVQTYTKKDKNVFSETSGKSFFER
jgi:hypothetical protein